MKGNSPKFEMSSGMRSPRLMPRPPPMPVRKNMGGPPNGPLIAPKMKNDVPSGPSDSPPKTDRP